MKLGKEAKLFALNLTEETINSMLEFPEVEKCSSELMDAYKIVLNLGNTEAIALMIIMLHQSLDYDQYLVLKEAFEQVNVETFVDNTLTYLHSNMLDEALL